MKMPNNKIKYVHEPDAHNLISPSHIVPYIIEKFNPKSVVDVGCGIGTFLHVFKQHNVQDVLGIDGPWVNKQQLNIEIGEFFEADLEKPINLNKVFDLVLCLEVAEHLHAQYADVLVDSLTSLGNKIVFSAATFRQGGQNHLNEQVFNYWKEKFAQRNFKVIDLFRPLFWNEAQIQWWYKQNMFLIVHESVDTSSFELGRARFTEENLIIHPELYYERLNEYDKKCQDLDRLHRGAAGNINFYLGLLIKSLKNKLRK